jgi:hypothetical protein
MAKNFGLGPDEIVTLAPGRGSCFASDRITVDGKPVGYCYRTLPDSPADSGWRFFAGDETQDYADNPANFEIYDVNTIINYDREILPLIDIEAPVQFERTGPGKPLQRIDSEPES